MNPTSHKLFLVVPCYNEAQVLPLSLPLMLQQLDGLDCVAETGIIIADDGSTDNTAQVARTYPDKRVRHLPLEHSGQQGALLGGIREALRLGADAVITLDADLQDDPSAISAMVTKWLEGKDVVYGVRTSRGNDSAFKKATARLFYSLMHLADKRHIRGHADFRLMSRECAEVLLGKTSPTGDLLRNVVPTLGFSSTIVYYERGDRAAGESKYGLSQMLGLSLKGLFSQVPFCIAIVCLVTFIAFFFTSLDSPMHDSMSAHGDYIRHDSAWFFMCGKAWINGMIPYVDFSDSKGPLLWLFYAIAYLMAPRSWIGVFWINAAAYVATSFLLFKTSLLFTESARKSLWIGILLNAAFFIPLLIFDDKAEVIALPFVALSFLMACRSLWGKGGSFFWWGFAFGAILLIKYNVAAMTGIFLIAMVTKLRNWKVFFRAVGSALEGFAVPILPMMAYLLWVGAADDFVNEYFITTFNTINIILSSGDKGEFLRHEMIGYICVAASGAVTAVFALKKARWFPPVALLWFWICLGRYARTYYFIPINVLMVFTAFGALRCLEKDWGWKRYFFGTLMVASLAFFIKTNAWTYEKDYLYGRDITLQRERSHAFVRLMTREEKPRVLYWGCGDHGFGIQAEDLPACKYWAFQAGSTEEMFRNQEDAARNHLADFVFVDTYDTRRQKLLLEWGYTRCYDPAFGTYRAFSKKAYPDLPDAPENQ